MRIMILADGNSAHTIRWVNALAGFNLEICLISLTTIDNDNYTSTIRSISLNQDLSTSSNSSWAEKLQYLRLRKHIRQQIKEFKPDILHAYYASSHGLLGALSGFQPYIISVWGSDVFEFPHQGILQKKILSYNLKKATLIQATSKALKLETQKYTQNPIQEIPFGIDLNQFYPKTIVKQEFVVGTIKGMRKVYGIDRLIQSFAWAVKLKPELKWKLLLVGDGPDRPKYEALCKENNIYNLVEFTGQVHHDQTVDYYNKMNLFVALSRSESFGVAVLEAAACEVPAIVSQVGGLPEVVINKKTGYIHQGDDYESIANRMITLALQEDLRVQLGKNARKFVAEKYLWEKNTNKQISIYQDLISKA
jgi:glycosyltransferase involved in cell wall biosynthesis